MTFRTLNPGFWRDMLRNAGDNSARHITERLSAAPTPACGACGAGRNAAPVAVVPPHSDEGISA